LYAPPVPAAAEEVEEDEAEEDAPSAGNSSTGVAGTTATTARESGTAGGEEPALNADKNAFLGAAGVADEDEVNALNDDDDDDDEERVLVDAAELSRPGLKKRFCLAEAEAEDERNDISNKVICRVTFIWV